MTSEPIAVGDGFKVRWRVKVDGVWKWQQSPIEREADDARRCAEMVESLPVRELCKVPLIVGRILQTDALIVGRAYMYGEAEARRRAANEPGVWTFRMSVDEYLAANTDTWSEGTEVGVRCALNKHYAAWMDQPVTAFGAAELNELWAGLRATDLKHNTIVDIMSRGKAVLRLAYANGRTAYNPRSEADKDRLNFRINPTSEFEREAIDHATFRELLGYAADDQTRAMLLTAVGIGTRLSELCALRVRDVRLTGSEPTITIVGSMYGATWRGWTKADHGRAKLKPRACPITAELAAALAPLVAGRSPNAPLFGYQDARKGRASAPRHWHPGTWRNAVWHPLVDRARAGGVVLPEDFTPHCLRHTMATWLAPIMDMAQLRLRMRHASIKMTARYYHDNAVARSKEFDAITNAMRWDEAA